MLGGCRFAQETLGPEMTEDRRVMVEQQKPHDCCSYPILAHCQTWGFESLGLWVSTEGALETSEMESSRNQRLGAPGCMQSGPLAGAT